MARRRMVDLAGLAATEDVQDAAKVNRIASALAGGDIMWCDQPAIIIDGDGAILDGHHRVAGARAAGLARYPAIIVDRAQWDAQAEAGHTAACLWACDEAGDDLTWGAVSNGR